MKAKPGDPYSIEIRLLGSFRVSVDGVPVPDSSWHQRKPAMLLQRLALEPHHRLHSEQLMEMLWPGAGAAASRNNLHKIIHMVRSALEPHLRRPADSHFLVTRGQQVALTAPRRLWIDLEAFQSRAAEAIKLGEPEALETALALYEGPLLPAEPYEPWVVERREQLELTVRQLLMELARACEAHGDADGAANALQRVLAADPVDEEAHRGLMRLLAAAGRRQLALRQYQECCNTLRRELDAEPEAATVELHKQIVAGEVQRSPARMAILPFENLTGSAELDYLSDGLTEILIGNLSRLPRLHVMAHSTVSRYRGQDPRQVAAALNVGSVVAGTILQRKDRLIVRVELVHATGVRAWGAEYEWPQESIAGLQEEISRAITEQLGMTPQAGRHTQNAEAYRCFLRGRYLWNRRTLDSVTRSIEYFRRAIEADPDYTLAWIGLADSYAKLGDVGVAALPPREAFSQAKIAAIRAVEIDNSLAEAHTTLAHLFMHDYEWREAEREFRSALRLNPSYATTHHWFAYQLLMTGQREEAFEEIGRALELEPLSVPINADYGELLYFARDYRAASEQYARTLELDDRFYPTHLGLGRVFLEMGEHQTALGFFSAARELSRGSSDVTAAIARAAAVSGREEEARELLARLYETARTQYISPYGIAAIHAALDENDEAFRWLERACEEHAAWSIYLSVDPRFDPLRGDPRFAAVLGVVGLEKVHVRLAS